MNEPIRKLISEIYQRHMSECTKTADFEVCQSVLCKLAYEAEQDLDKTQQEIIELRCSEAQEKDEFNTGYQAFEAGLDVTTAEIEYRAALPDEVPSYDVFRVGYAWAKECRAMSEVK